MTSLQNLKQVVYILSILLIFWSFSLNSCKNTQKKESFNKKTIVFEDFMDFPNHPFLHLDFHQSYIDNKSLLIDNGFIQKDDYTFLRIKDSTSFIFSNINDVSEFIIYFKSNYFLTHQKDLYQLLESKSNIKNGSNQFSEFFINSSESNSYKMTYFVSENYIRLKYILKK